MASIRTGDVTMLNGGDMPARWAAIDSGRADAAVFTVGDVVQAKDLGLKVLAQAADVVDMPENGVAVADGKLAERPDQVKAMLNAMIDAIAYIAQEPGDSARVLADWIGVEESQALLQIEAMLPSFSRDLTVSDEGLRQTIDAEKSAAGITRDIPPDEAVTSDAPGGYPRARRPAVTHAVGLPGRAGRRARIREEPDHDRWYWAWLTRRTQPRRRPGRLQTRTRNEGIRAKVTPKADNGPPPSEVGSQESATLGAQAHESATPGHRARRVRDPGHRARRECAQGPRLTQRPQTGSRKLGDPHRRAVRSRHGRVATAPRQPHLWVPNPRREPGCRTGGPRGRARRATLIPGHWKDRPGGRRGRAAARRGDELRRAVVGSRGAIPWLGKPCRLAVPAALAATTAGKKWWSWSPKGRRCRAGRARVMVLGGFPAQLDEQILRGALELGSPSANWGPAEEPPPEPVAAGATDGPAGN